MRRTTTLSREELNRAVLDLVAQEVSSNASLIAEAGELHRGLTVAGNSESTVAEIVRAIRAETISAKDAEGLEIEESYTWNPAIGWVLDKKQSD